MVEVIGRTKKENEFKKKCKKLECITKDNIPFSFSIHSSSAGMFGIFSREFSSLIFNVYPHKNEIILDNKNYFNETLKVAEAYEKEFKETWTLKKDYNE